jgi:hypothetical protein
MAIANSQSVASLPSGIGFSASRWTVVSVIGNTWNLNRTQASAILLPSLWAASLCGFSYNPLGCFLVVTHKNQ